MKYMIYLDNQQIDDFESDEATAIGRYELLRDEFKGEDIYDEIKLFKNEIFKTDKL